MPAGDDGCAAAGDRRDGRGRVIAGVAPLPPIDEPALEATLQAIAAGHGYVSNLLQTLVLAPDGLRLVADLLAYCRSGTMLTDRQRVLIMLVAMRDVHYGWALHAPLATLLGVTEEQLLLIRDGRSPRSLAEDDAALCDYAFEMASGRRIPPRVAEALHRHFNARQIVDIALTAAHALAVAALAVGLEVPAEPPEVVALEQERLRARLASDGLSPA